MRIFSALVRVWGVIHRGLVAVLLFALIISTLVLTLSYLAPTDFSTQRWNRIRFQSGIVFADAAFIEQKAMSEISTALLRVAAIQKNIAPVKRLKDTELNQLLVKLSLSQAERESLAAQMKAVAPAPPRAIVPFRLQLWQPCAAAWLLYLTALLLGHWHETSRSARGFPVEFRRVRTADRFA